MRVLECSELRDLEDASSSPVGTRDRTRPTPMFDLLRIMIHDRDLECDEVDVAARKSPCHPEVIRFPRGDVMKRSIAIPGGRRCK